MSTLTVQPDLYFEFELQDETVRLCIKLPMHICENPHILGRSKRDYIWIIGAALLPSVITVPALPAPSGLCQLMAA